MRRETQIRHQLSQVAYRHLRRLLKLNDKRIPDRCSHNKRVLLQPYPIGFCCFLIDGKPRWIPCDSRVEGGEAQAKICPWWEALKTEVQIRASFQQLLTSKDRGRIAVEFPDIAALMWVLDEEFKDETFLSESLNIEEEKVSE